MTGKTPLKVTQEQRTGLERAPLPRRRRDFSSQGDAIRREPCVPPLCTNRAAQTLTISDTARRSESGESALESHRAYRRDIDARPQDRCPRRNADRIRSRAIAPSVPGG